MFDFILKYGKTELRKRIYNKTLNIYKNKRYKIYEKYLTGFSIIGLSYEDEMHTAFEDDQLLIVIIGNIFHNSKYNKQYGKLEPKEVLALCREEENILKRIKGEFTIIRFKKSANKLTIINDHFALKPVYYSMSKGEIIVSNNINLFRELDYDINDLSVLEKILFTYPISDNTLLSNVKELNGGEVIEAGQKDIKVTNSFSLEDMIFKSESEKFSHKKLTKLLNHSVKQKSSNKKINICSLTGGFDGRTIVSSLLKQDINFFTYSFGKRKGENTEVPLNVSNRLNIDYRPIYLEKDFEDNYFKYGVESIFASDGLSSFERSNYSYAFKILSEYSNTVFSGLITGEILRPIHLKCDYMNELYYEIFYENKKFDLKKYIDDNHFMKFINKEWAMSLNEQLQKKILLRQQLITDIKKKYKNDYLFYLYDLINLGFRKFYGNEMHLERFYADNISPFFDIEILNYLFNSTYINIYKRAFKKSLLLRWKGQIIYSNIIKNNYPELGEIPVDRGYPPNYLIKIIKRIFIPYLYLKRKYHSKKNNLDFDQKRWNYLFFDSIKNNDYNYSEIFNAEELKKYISTYKEKDHSGNINKVVSLYYWLYL